MMKTREQVLPEDQWNIESLFPSPEAWDEALKSFVPNPQQAPHWPALQKLRGTLHQGVQHVRNALENIMSIDRQLAKFYTYAHLRHDEDIANPEYKKRYEHVLRLSHALTQETAAFQPELLALPDAVLSDYLSSPVLADYRFYLEKIIRMKKHTLSQENEHLLALAGQALQTSYKTFSALSDADFKFGEVTDSQGNNRPISHGTYGLYIRDQDRLLRERAFKQYHHQYLSYENTLCELLNGQVQTHLLESRARHYSSCLEAALFPKNIDVSVFHSLVQAVHERLDALHRYMDVRKRILKLDQLHLWDVYVPLIKAVDIHMTYQEAEQIVIDSVEPLGSHYQETLRKGLHEQRWVDRYENINKRSGAYSSGCYDSVPYILMNYKGLLRDVFTLAHEAGHSMHSFYSNQSQPYQYCAYPIFVAEVASTFNEDLLTRLLINRCQDPHKKIFLINQKVEDIRATLFRQTMFAEFELLIHQHVEQHTPLTPQLLKQEYHRLNQLYFGPHLTIDEEIDIEWARIPHFYYNFYVFQYATGISAALALADKVVTGTEKDRNAYLAFLQGGSSQYPIEMLKMAGIDMTSPAPVKAAIHAFDQLVTELEGLLSQV